MAQMGTDKSCFCSKGLKRERDSNYTSIVSQNIHGVRMRALIIIALAIFLTGCNSLSHQENGVTQLDNRGGFSHAGRHIWLEPDGSFTDVRYTDVLDEPQPRTTGRYTLDAEKRLLTLSPEGGEVEHLYRVDYRGQQYWVHADKRARITQSGESWLRQISLRVYRERVGGGYDS